MKKIKHTMITHQPVTYHSSSILHAWLVGHPRPTAVAVHQAIGKRVGLAVFTSDALSSTDYAPLEILVILAAAGNRAFGYAFSIVAVIVALLAIVTISYEQTIHAYPDGGGAVCTRYRRGRCPLTGEEKK